MCNNNIHNTSTRSVVNGYAKWKKTNVKRSTSHGQFETKEMHVIGLPCAARCVRVRRTNEWILTLYDRLCRCKFTSGHRTARHAVHSSSAVVPLVLSTCHVSLWQAHSVYNSHIFAFCSANRNYGPTTSLECTTNTLVRLCYRFSSIFFSLKKWKQNQKLSWDALF